MSPAKIRLALIGAKGRMGREIARLARDDDAFTKSYEVVAELGDTQPASLELLGQARAGLVIDFSVPSATAAVAAACQKLKVPVLVGTTGLSATQRESLATTLQNNAWALVPNTSLGVYALGEALRRIFSVLPAEFQVSMIDIHHAAKKDSPSGTAKLLADIIQKSRPGDLPVPTFSIRAGTDPGEHKIVILGPGERLELTHRAESRELFARGALRLGVALSQKAPRKEGYTIGELL